MLKKFFLFIVVVVILLVAGMYIYFDSLKPNYNGSLSLSGLTAETNVYYDEFGIPHIYSDSETDAYRALGYVHAQDRLFQMEVIRRIAPGRLSEIFGSKLLQTDKFFRALSIAPYSAQSVEEFQATAHPKIKAAVQAYLDGVNHYLENGPTPIEYTILGIEKQPFTLLDVYNTVGYMSFSFAQAHKTEPVLTKILNELGEDYLNDLDLQINTSGALMKSYFNDQSVADIATNVDQIMSHLPTAPWIGSNSWVIGPEKTTSGKVILANDPHIAYSQPCVWYEAHMEAPGLSIYGYHLAGFPFAIIGHNRQSAYGLTMFMNDDIDFYFEKVNPDNDNQYRDVDEWKDFESRVEKIEIKDSVSVEFEVRTSRHGPIMNDALELEEDMDPVSMYWVYTSLPGKVLTATYDFAHAERIGDSRKAAASIHAPGLNVMYGDADDNYARWSSARLPKRPEHVSGKLILDGSTRNDDILGYYDFEYNPQSENAPWGYAYSANNRPDTTKGILHLGYYLSEDRARRIMKMLDDQSKWDVESTKKMMTDVQSENVPEIVSSILSGIDRKLLKSENEELALKSLQEWDGVYSLDSKAAIVYTKMLYKIQAQAIGLKIGEKTFETYLATHAMKRSIQPLFANDSSVWWDDLTTDAVETRMNVMTNALIDGVAELEGQLGQDFNQWRWGDVHTLEHNHAFGAVAALKKYFNVGPFNVPGAMEVINNYLFRLNPEGKYNVHAGPSTRRIVDFSDVENNSWSILPTGNSGNVFSPHYADQASMYVKGEFRKMKMNKDDIMSSSKNLLVLKPE